MLKLEQYTVFVVTFIWKIYKNNEEVETQSFV